MGRRKIEIKAIKDDRNRAVTFLKRKGGLFKKAHELSVLCSVDVAVIIFGHNKKLYEYSSGDMNEVIGRYQYYGIPHEHKGPADFGGRDMDDDDDEDVGTPPPDDTSMPPEDPFKHDHSIGGPHLQNQIGFHHMRQGPSSSPPMANGIPYSQRQHTPQPPGGSRPASRADGRRQSSNLGPQHAPQMSQVNQGQNGYAYVPNPPIFNPHAAQGMPVAPHHGGQHRAPPQFQYTHPPQHPQVQQVYMHDHQRRQSMPPAFPQQERPQPQQARVSPPQSEVEQRTQELEPQQPKPMPAKSRSIFTPIDDNRSLLAQHWGIGSTTVEPRSDVVKQEKDNRSQSVDVGAVQRLNAAVPAPPSTKPQRAPPPVSRSGDAQPPSRISSAQLGAKRPRLKVQIPDEQSDGEDATAESSPRDSGEATGDTPAKGSTDASHSSGVVLPPPSPSASAVLSAGAQGPPNPFARPLPPTQSNSNNQSYSSNNNIETPISALPSRFITEGLLPSPSAFYPEWGFSRGGPDSNTLPSPLNFQTPVTGNGPSFLRDEDSARKRKSPEGDGQETNLKRVKT